MKGCRPLTEDEITAVLAALSKNRYHTRDRALFLLGLRSGFRISELLSLTLSDIHQNGSLVNRVYVQRRNMKKKIEGRDVILHAEAREALAALILPEIVKEPLVPSHFIFQSRKGLNFPLQRRAAWHILKKAYAQCGLSGKLGTHSMRKTYAKEAYELSGRDLLKTQKLLGQKNINSTIHYLSVDNDDLDAIVLKMGRKA